MKRATTSASIFFILITISIEIVDVSSSSPFLHESQVYEGSAGGRHNKHGQEHAHEVHCSRERSRAASKIIEEYLMPFVERENYQLPTKCRLHPDYNIFRDQEEHKIYIDINEWRCGYCKKSFRAEKFLDQHFDNRHHNLLNVVLKSDRAGKFVKTYKRKLRGEQGTKKKDPADQSDYLKGPGNPE